MMITTRKEGICPLCGSDMVDFQGADVTHVFTEMYHCDNCDNEFYQVYEFVYSHSNGYETEE